MSAESKQLDDLLTIINMLYSEKERERGLKELSEHICEEKMRALYLHYSYGIVTILQEEILSVYKYLNSDNLSQQEEIRLCNALTILRSIVSVSEFAFFIVKCNILYFLGPLIQSSSPRFSNIRKICLAILFEISAKKDNDRICITIINQGLLRICLSVFDNTDDKEQESILIILSNFLCKPQVSNHIRHNQQIIVMIEQIFTRNTMFIRKEELRKHCEEIKKLLVASDYSMNEMNTKTYSY